MLCKFSSNFLKKNYPERKVSEATHKTSGREKNSSVLYPLLTLINLKDLNCNKPLHQEFLQPGKTDSSQERKLEVHTTPQLSQALTSPIYFLRSYLSFPKITYFHPSSLHSPSPFLIQIVYKLSRPDILGGIYFFSVMPLAHNNKS